MYPKKTFKNLKKLKKIYYEVSIFYILKKKYLYFLICFFSLNKIQKNFLITFMVKFLLNFIFYKIILKKYVFFNCIFIYSINIWKLICFFNKFIKSSFVKNIDIGFLKIFSCIRMQLVNMDLFSKFSFIIKKNFLLYLYKFLYINVCYSLNINSYMFLDLYLVFLYVIIFCNFFKWQLLDKLD
jgi:hypothetical protein